MKYHYIILSILLILSSRAVLSSISDAVFHGSTKQLYLPVVDIQGSNSKSVTFILTAEGRFQLSDLRDSFLSVPEISASYSGKTGLLQIPRVNADGIFYTATLSLYSTDPAYEFELISLSDADPLITDSESCGLNNSLFSIAPLAAESYFQIDPLGATNPSAHTFPTVHTYMMLTNNNHAATVYAPADIGITSVSQVKNLSAGSTDHVIAFTPCSEVSAYFDHVTTLTVELTSQIGDFGDCRRYFSGLDEYEFCTKEVAFNVTAGTVLGYAGGNGALSAALDFGLRDSRIKPIAFLSPGRLVANDQLYVACPYDYYQKGTVYDQLQAKLQESRTTSPLCGSVAYDQIDSLQGLWYLVGSSDFGEEAHIALVPSNTQPNGTGVLSIGNSSLGSDAYYFDYTENGQNNRKFTAVSSDNTIYCWDNLRNRAASLSSGHSQSLSGYFFIQMTDNRSLTIERINSSENCPKDPNSLIFSSNVLLFER
jgi:hypothetical protein